MKHSFFLKRRIGQTSCAVSMAAVLLLSGNVLLVSAQTTQSLAAEKMDADRFQMKREGDTIIRLDKQTGAMSSCVLKASSLVCRMAADERTALETEIASLQSQLDNVNAQQDDEKDIADSKPEIEADQDASKESAENNKQDEVRDQELDKMVDMTTKVLRRFFSVMKELRDDFAEKPLQD